MEKRRRSGGASVAMTNHEMETLSKQIYEDCLDELILGVAFDVHRSVKTGLFAVLEVDSPSFKDQESSSALTQNLGVDVFGQVISTMLGVPALKKQPECVCPGCQRNLAASRFAPHLEKCMGMGRNSSRLASRRLATSGKEANYRESGMDGDGDDEEWIEPTKVALSNRRRHRDKNSPRRTKTSSQVAKLGYTSKNGGDIFLVTASDGSITPPASYDVLSIDERSNLLASICGVITSASKKICTRTTRCPMHTDAQRREVRIRWLSNEEETHVDIDSFTEGDTAALRESLAQLSGASSPAESVVSTSSNPSATSSIRGGRREKSRRGKKKGHSGSSKSASRGSTPPLMAD